jgi:hypothetical protein
MSGGRVGKKPIADAFSLRNTREADWFWLQDELVDDFAPLIGPYAFALYVCLARRSKGNSGLTQWSHRDLEKVWRSQHVRGVRAALSRSSIQRAMTVLLGAGLIVEERAASRSEGAVYALPSLKQLGQTLTAERAEMLAARLEQLRTRLADADLVVVSCGPQGATKGMLKTSGKASVKAGISTDSSGPHQVPTEPDVAPVGATPLFIKEERVEEYPPTPLEGGEGRRPLSNAGDRPEAEKKLMVQTRQRWHVVMQSVRNHMLNTAFSPAARRGTHGLKDGLDEWNRYFEQVALVGAEAAADGRRALVLEAATPDLVQEGLVKYARTWNRALEGAFGYIPELRMTIKPAA